MTCKYCKCHIEDGQKFCPSCGELVSKCGVPDKKGIIQQAKKVTTGRKQEETGSNLTFDKSGASPTSSKKLAHSPTPSKKSALSPTPSKKTDHFNMVEEDIDLSPTSSFMGFWDWVKTYALMILPLANIALLAFWAFGKENTAKKPWARATLIWVVTSSILAACVIPYAVSYAANKIEVKATEYAQSYLEDYMRDLYTDVDTEPEEATVEDIEETPEPAAENDVEPVVDNSPTGNEAESTYMDIKTYDEIESIAVSGGYVGEKARVDTDGIVAGLGKAKHYVVNGRQMLFIPVIFENETTYPLSPSTQFILEVSQGGEAIYEDYETVPESKSNLWYSLIPVGDKLVVIKAFELKDTKTAVGAVLSMYDSKTYKTTPINDVEYSLE